MFKKQLNLNSAYVWMSPNNLQFAKCEFAYLFILTKNILISFPQF